jgi:hypothetical protein
VIPSIALHPRGAIPGLLVSWGHHALLFQGWHASCMNVTVMEIVVMTNDQTSSWSLTLQ